MNELDNLGKDAFNTDSGPFGYSKASSRYEPSKTKPVDKYGRDHLLLEWIGHGKRVLELGCSTGYMSRDLAARGCHVTGVERDPTAAKTARAYCEAVYELDLNVPSWFSALGTVDFDIILLGDVLEHLVRPDETLVGLQGLLNSDGSLVISLPNVVHWATRLKVLSGQFNYESFGTLDHTHLRFFTAKTARAMIEAAGYHITKFHPSIGGRMNGQIRPVWQLLAKMAPGLFAYQLLFEAKKQPRTEI